VLKKENYMNSDFTAGIQHQKPIKIYDLTRSFKIISILKT
jgi:hypothetical protein